jgi:hypothetical protein
MNLLSDIFDSLEFIFIWIGIIFKKLAEIDYIGKTHQSFD